jgi:taurine---2-oxoglutarate transaminase
MSVDRTKMSNYDRERASVFHSWSAQNTIKPLMVKSAKGLYVTDEDGNTYLDFSSQLVNVNIGHQQPDVVEAIRAQAAELCTIAPQHGNPARFRAAELILDHSFEGAAKVFFTNGGTEATEHAVRMARLHTGRPKILARYRSYHGATATSINLTGDPRRWSVDTANAGVVHFFGPFLYRSQFHSENEEQECQRALEHLRSTIEFEGPSTIAAIILESVPGTAGIMVPPKGYLKGVRALCDEFGIVYIADEVMCGFGRTGAWFGYIPLGGVVINQAICDTFADRVYPGGLTYSGHPLACASAVAAIEMMERDGVIENAKSLGDDVLRPALLEMAKRHPIIGDIRGLGVFFAVELVINRETKEPLAPYGGSSPAMNELVAACRAEGLLVFNNFNRIHVVPPCVTTKTEAVEGLERFERALTTIDHYAKA